MIWVLHMHGQYPVLLIDDDAQRAQECKVILEFLGRRCVSLSGENWSNTTPSTADFSGVIIGRLGSDKQFSKILDEVTRMSKNLALILMDEPSDAENNNNSARANLKSEQLIGRINWPVQQNELMEVLHACDDCKRGASNPEKIRSSKLILKRIVGQSNLMATARKLIGQVAYSEATVLILGESGTGKEVAARCLHDLSGRSDKPFVPINCGAIPADLLESELFGHEKGAFTGALTTRKGRFELAEGGTIFLDEIGDMPMPMQVKLLRVLQEKAFERVGSGKSIDSNVRIIAATHRNLSIEVKEGRFREDLFYRLNVFPINMPALRERVEDMDQLVSKLVSRLEADKRGSVRLSPDAIQSLMLCLWPGNVRELANLLERLCILYPYSVVDTKDLPEEYRHNSQLTSYKTVSKSHPTVPKSSSAPDDQESSTPVNGWSRLPASGVDLKKFVKQVEVSYIEQALVAENWVVARAAKRLKMQRTTLVEKMRKYQLQKS